MESFEIKSFDNDTRPAKVLTPLVSLGEIIPWFPAVYNYESQNAQRNNKRIVIVVPKMFECLVERFPCSQRIVIGEEYHLSMIWHRFNRLHEPGMRWPKPENWEQKSQTLITELKPYLESIAWGDTVGVYFTDVHTYSPALPTRCNHWSLDRYEKVDQNDPRNWIIFNPPQEALDSFQYNWDKHPRPFVAIRTHSGIIDAQKRWSRWDEFLKIMEDKFEGTVFRLGGLDDCNVKLEPRRNFIDLALPHNSTVAPLLSQMSCMDYCITPVGGIGWVALALKVPTLMYVDGGCQGFYHKSGYDYSKGWGTERVERFFGNLFDDFTEEWVFGEFREFTS